MAVQPRLPLLVAATLLLSRCHAFSSIPSYAVATQRTSFAFQQNRASNAVAISSHGAPAASALRATYAPMFDFSQPTSEAKAQSALSFERIDDAIMGGISLSTLRDVPTQPYASWSGVCRTDGGGFCGMRTLPFTKPLNATGQDGVYLDCKLASDDEAAKRVWKMTVRTDSSRGEQVYQAEYDLQTAMNEAKAKNEEWARVVVPFDTFQLVRGPRLVPDGPKLDLTGGVFQIGMTMSKFKMAQNTTELDGFRPGFFDMHIQRIGFYNGEGEGSVPVEKMSSNVPKTLSKEEAEKKRPLLLKLLLPVAKIFFSEKANRRKSAMRILREDRGLSRGKAILFGIRSRKKTLGTLQSIMKTAGILGVDAFRAVFLFGIKLVLLYPLRIIGPRPLPKNFTPLGGCTTLEEHEDRVRSALDAARGLEGEEGLRAMGFEFRFVPCCPAHEEEHKLWVEGDAPPQSPEEDEPTRMKKSISVVSFFSANSSLNEQFASHCNNCATRLFYVGRPAKSKESSQDVDETNGGAAEIITTDNRKQTIADGHMYERVANLAQEAAQSRMCSTFEMEWATVCNDETLGEKVRALVDKDHHLLLEEGENRVVLHELLLGRTAGNGAGEKKLEEGASIHRPASLNRTRSTLLIATGRGKVRAGIFSRHHLLTAGIEVGTSWHCIREARMRRWGVAIIDPNARGEGAGFESFKRSVSRIFLGDAAGEEEATSSTPPATKDASTAKSATVGAMSREPSCTSLSTKSSKQPHHIYILAHSASGGQLVRHLREDPTLLPSIRAVAFTDSTHSVQWAKHNHDLKEFLQTSNCVYLRSNDVRSSQSCVRVSSRGKDIQCDCLTCADRKKSSGMDAPTDHFWEHRFGRIKTKWAGTADHALSNWAGHETIWDHFDEHASDEEGNASEASSDGVGVVTAM
ncbi:hypothetical protein ACHAXT_005137 [Thalassiosira profunda]